MDEPPVYPLTMDCLVDKGLYTENDRRVVYRLYMPADFKDMITAKYFIYADEEHAILLYTTLVYLG